jgi:hypothetical protein
MGSNRLLVVGTPPSIPVVAEALLPRVEKTNILSVAAAMDDAVPWNVVELLETDRPCA